MATFTLPKNSKITGKSRTHKAEGGSRIRKFKIYRYDPDSGENPRYDTFELDLDDWADLRTGCGTLAHFARPRDLDAELGPEY